MKVAGLGIVGWSLAGAAIALTACSAPDPAQVGQVLVSSTTSGSSPPGSAAVAGRLVTGFPAVVPIPPQAKITASAVQPATLQPGLLAVSVSGSSQRSAASLLEFFHDRLRRAGFSATEDSLLPQGADGAAFSRRDRELLLVAVVDRGSQRSWSVGGMVAP